MYSSTQVGEERPKAERYCPPTQNHTHMRKRIKTPVCSAKLDGRVIRYEKPVMSTHAKIKAAIRELGGDTKQIMSDIRWRILCNQIAVSVQ